MSAIEFHAFEDFFAVLNGLLATMVCFVSVDAFAFFEGG